MDKMLKNELGLSKAMKFWMTVGLTSLLVVSVYFCYRLYFITRTAVREQAIRSITNISQLNKDSVSRPIANRRIMMEMVSSRMEDEKLEGVDEILNMLEGYRTANDFYSIGVITQEKFLHLTNGKVADVSGTEFGTVAWDGQFHLSASYRPYAGGDYQTNAFTYPVYYDGELKYVLLATYLSRNLTERMNLSSMAGKGFNFIIDTQGKVVIYPRDYENEEYNALMKYLNDTSAVIPNAKKDVHFNYQNESYYAHFEELGINQWYLMTCARESDVFAEAYVITQNAFLSLSLLWLVTVISVVSIAYSIYRSRKELRRSVFYDELLGIGNANALNVYFRKLPPERLCGMYLVVFDIDKFKEFNYIYGNENGDKLLQYIVRVFREELPQVYLFRHGSDYFITLDESDTPEQIDENIQKTLRRYAKDIADGVIQPFDTSAGVRKVDLEVPVRQLVSDAIIARDAIKGNHLLHHTFYDEEIRLKRMRYMEMESGFSRALREKEFHVYYQPKYDMKTGKIIGAEALARWIKKDGTIISPGEFVPCFEDSRQITLLDEVMLAEVCRQMKEMEQEGINVKRVSVNLSRVHLRQQGILTKIEKIIKDSGVNPAMLSFEITESALYEDNIPLKVIVDVLHNLGCKVDMDDYGVGVSGPNALATNQFDTIKLDKSFIDGIGNQHIEDVIESTITLANKWGMEILAEGVEEKYQAERLLEFGCEMAQGFYYSKPVPEAEYRKLLVMDGAGTTGWS
ncbi:MAG: EAL domain-containing protein [Eubacteriales bacterium]|nr:EAL domain-containing protein [Eubacteriales bacterium]